MERLRDSRSGFGAQCGAAEFRLGTGAGIVKNTFVLGISKDRVIVYGCALAIMASLPFILFPSWFHDVAYRGDFANFWSAGANAGSSALLDYGRMGAWQKAHGITPQIFVYPPAFAWLYAPLSHLTPMLAMVIADVFAIALLGVAALLAARIYGVPRWLAIMTAVAWGPAMNAWQVGQNTTLALALIFAAIFFVQRGRTTAAALAIGLLLYKPSVALPFVVLLLIRREWRMLWIVGACGLLWYGAGVVSSGGSWLWPETLTHLIAQVNRGEFTGNAYKAYTLPTLLLAIGVPISIAYAAAIGLFAAAVPLLARARSLEAWSILPAIGLATSIHSWPYEATLLLPAVFFAMRRLEEPLREQVIIFGYVVATFALIVPYGGHALAVLAVGTAVAWVIAGYWKGARYAYRPADAR
jgi:hypothetical protein